MLRLFAVALCFALALPLAAQPVRPVIGLRLGAVPTLQEDESKRQQALYPELEIGMTPMQVGDSDWTMAGRISVGVWDDGASAPAECSDCEPYARRSIVLGFQSFVAPPGSTLPLALRVGISHHFVWTDYIGERNVSFFPTEGTRHYSTLDLGARLAFPLSGRLDAVFDMNTAAVLMRFREERSFADRTRWTLGATYVLR
jgi:hypothetical protein